MKIEQLTAASSRPLHKNTPLRYVARQKLESALIHQRSRTRELLAKVERLKKKMKPVELSPGLHEGLSKVMEESEQHNSEFVQLFWREQKKMFSVKKQGEHKHKKNYIILALHLFIFWTSLASYASEIRLVAAFSESSSIQDSAWHWGAVPPRRIYTEVLCECDSSGNWIQLTSDWRNQKRGWQIAPWAVSLCSMTITISIELYFLGNLSA